MKFEGIDLFAGAGGTTTGIENANYGGRRITFVRAAINHSSTAVKYAINLARKNSEALSFIPSGFLVFGNTFPILKIYQACIQYDARRIQHGLNILHRLITYAECYGFTAISLYCADDLEANQFWQAAGFKFAGQRLGGRRRGRIHNRWILHLNSPFWNRNHSPELIEAFKRAFQDGFIAGVLFVQRRKR